MRFLLDHMANCSPLNPCVSCKAVELLKKKLPAIDQKVFWELVCTANGVNYPLGTEPPEGGTIDMQLAFQQVLPDLSDPIKDYLKSDGIVTIGDLVSRTERDLLGIPRIGNVSVKEIKTHLDRLGLEVAGGWKKVVW